MRTIQEVEEELDQLQKSYLEEEDEGNQVSIEWKFARCLEEATEIDGVLRNASGVTIHNWTKESND